MVFELIYPDEVKSFVPDKNTQYVLSYDFLKPFPNVSEVENLLADKYLTLLGIDLDSSVDKMIKIHPMELFNLFVSIQKEHNSYQRNIERGPNNTP